MFPYLAVLLTLFRTAGPGNGPGCVIVVNDANKFYSASVAQVADLFLGKRTSWDNGNHVSPVDQTPASPVREEFSTAILGRPLQAVQAYWRGRVYRKDAIPPPELDSDQAVIEYVRTHADAIGYVSAEAPLSAGVHAVVVMQVGTN